VPEVRLEEADLVTQEWLDASDWFETLSCNMTSVGGVIQFRYAGMRVNDSPGAVYRLVFPEREDTITVPQVVGDMAVVVTTPGTEDDPERSWAIYPLVGTPEGRLETPDPFSQNWPVTASGDVVQFAGTWFI